jgi:hypothetical protein
MGAMGLGAINGRDALRVGVLAKASRPWGAPAPVAGPEAGSGPLSPPA